MALVRLSQQDDALVLHFESERTRINAYTLEKGNFRGELRSVDQKPITIDGLWALRVGNGGGPPFGGDPNAIYFTAGINGEMDGLFGTITKAGG